MPGRTSRGTRPLCHNLQRKFVICLIRMILLWRGECHKRKIHLMVSHDYYEMVIWQGGVFV